jgi:MoaA/NifB/PqqE/SkfB family radical SAM enzyme
MNKLYSSFSQTKGLLWREWLDGIIEGNFLPPVGAVIDLTDRCQLKCGWCNAQAFRSENTLETDHVKKIVDDLADWRVKSVCFAGGGEPSLHKDFAELVRYSSLKGLEIGISTNGVSLSADALEAIANCARFCGFSIDAGSEKTWQRLKKSKCYGQVIASARALANLAADTQLDFTYKFMLTPHNQHEIWAACKLAREIGFKSFFVRPAAFQNIPGLNAEYKFDTRLIQRQLKTCLSLETELFQVYGSFRRVDEKLRRILPFTRCLATPLVAVFCADGYCYLCIDYRERPYGKICRHLELREFWNSPEHHKLINEIKLEHCPRCAMGNYNEQIAAFQADQMFKWFP